MSWNFGDILDGVGGVLPSDAPALLHADRRVSWGEFTQRSNALAAALIARGAKPYDKVALYMRNRPEYLVALAACFKARLVHVNVNFRYRDEELWYILDNSDARFVFFGEDFAEQAEQILAMGFTELGLYYPMLEDQLEVFEQIATEVFPQLR